MALAIPEKKALVVRVRDSAKIRAVLKHQNLGAHPDGGEMIAVPLKSESLQVLRNLGIDVGVDMAPINYLYNHPKLRGLFGPMPHQAITAAHFSCYPRAYCFNDPRTGKTASVIWATDFLKKEKTIVGGTLVITTIATMRGVWRDEIFSITPQRTVAVLYGSRETRQKLLASTFDYYVINHDGIKTIGSELTDAILSGRIQHIIVDEGSEFSDHETQKWKILKGLCDAAQRVWWLTGTPISKGPDAAWAQAQCVTPRNVPERHGEWKAQVMVKVNKYKWVPRADAKERVFSALQPAIRFEKRDVLKNLPPLTHQYFDVDLTSAQDQMIRALRKNKAVITEDGNSISAVNAAVVVGKVLQICAGTVKRDDGEPEPVPCGPRLTALFELLDGTDNKVLVFASHRAVVDMLFVQIRDHLAKQERKVVWVDGRVTGRARDNAIRSFREDEEVKVFLAHPKTVGHGLEFSVADRTVWWSPYHSPEVVAQVNERMASAAQRNPMGIYYLVGNATERSAYQTVRDGLSLQDASLKLFKEFVQDA